MLIDEKIMKTKILAVDDNPKNIQVLGSILRDAGYSVGFATDGEQALKILENSPDFDLVLMDINMPKMNGLEACQEMRKREKLKDIPVIFLTARDDVEDMVTGFKSGGQDYVTKPFSSEEILARLKTHVELKQKKDQLKMVNLHLEQKVKERTQELQVSHENLEKAYEELKVLDQSKSDFLSIISHQINTPLNGILGFIDLLKDKITDTHLKELFSYLEQSANRLDAFAKLSLRITELRTRKLLVDKREVSIKSLVKTSEENLSEKLKEKKIQIHFENNSPFDIISGDLQLLQFCFESIFENAIQHSHESSNIILKIENNENKICCFFMDEGVGFDSEMIKQLFNLFVTGDKNRDENKGLDLALVKIIAELHKGKVKAYNQEGKGAVVSLTLPLLN
ncbi:hybrid sensor histidine kinase/response regulator [Marinifilum sp. RC60d5]|uniref:hybrid sensor histidine kinase/response regulator n=1 Tax=Marinifilum sp. RC60d5 TaxID=3458414 RepID=UPI004035E6CC